jgi:hypothetical protein
VPSSDGTLRKHNLTEMVSDLIKSGMPKRKTSEAEAAPVPEAPVKRTSTKRSTTPAAHKHTTKKSQVVSPSEPVSTPTPASAAPLSVGPLSVTPTTTPTTITHEQIALRAYFLWEGRGKNGGSPASDWFQAEQQLRAELLAIA